MSSCQDLLFEPRDDLNVAYANPRCLGVMKRANPYLDWRADIHTPYGYGYHSGGRLLLIIRRFWGVDVGVVP